MKINPTFLFVFLLFATASQAQVGINTERPKATLEIKAKDSTGALESREGLVIPNISRTKARIMGDKLLANDRPLPGTLVYINNVSDVGGQTGSAINISSTGLYMFNTQRTTWIDLNLNLYSGNGLLATNKTVDMGTRNLSYTSTATTGTSHFSIDSPTFSVNTIADRVGIGTTSPQSTLHVQGNARIDSRPLQETILPSIMGSYIPVYAQSSTGELSTVVSANFKRIYTNKKTTPTAPLETITAFDNLPNGRVYKLYFQKEVSSGNYVVGGEVYFTTIFGFAMFRPISGFSNDPIQIIQNASETFNPTGGAGGEYEMQPDLNRPYQIRFRYKTGTFAGTYAIEFTNITDTASRYFFTIEVISEQ